MGLKLLQGFVACPEPYKGIGALAGFLASLYFAEKIGRKIRSGFEIEF
ncbi:MAG: hypothetical protein QW451_02565 [Candidatus Aenigmatarchaeota archaeon]